MAGEENCRARGSDRPEGSDASAFGRELATLNLLISVTSAGLNLPTLLSTVLESAAELIGLPVGLILLWDESCRALRVAAGRQLPTGALPGDGLIREAEFERYLSGRVYVTQAPVFVADSAAAAEHADTQAVAFGATAMAAVPLSTRQQRLGVLMLASMSPRAFPAGDGHILQMIGRQLAVAIENARLYEDAARRADQMRLLVELGQRVSAILDLDALLKVIVADVQRTFRCPMVALGLVEADHLRVTIISAAPGAPASPQETTMPLDAGLSGWVVSHQQALCVPDVAADSRHWNPPEIPLVPIVSAVALPIALGGQLLGVLNLESDRPAAFDPQDVALLQTVANQVAVAISNARTYARAAQQAATLRAMLSTTQELNSTLDLRQLLEAIAGQVSALIALDNCVIWLLNPQTGVLTPVVARHDWADQVLGVTLKLGEGITGRVAQSGIGEIVNRADLDPRAVSIPGTPEEPEALLAAPLRFKGRVLGVMTLSRLGEHEFLPADLELVDSFASQAAVAVENARLYTESLQRARQLERAHARLLAAQGQLVQAEKLSAVGQLAAGMAHELNNPLTAIIGFAQLLEAESLSPSGRSDLRRILTASARAQKIVANLLTFARQQRISPQPVDLAALVEHTLRLHGRGETNAVSTHQELAADLPEACVDPLQIEQLIVHLLRNAYHSTDRAGGGTVRVCLTRPNPESVRLEVADQGKEIPADQLPRIFDPFATADLDDPQGLSLSACFGIVRAHRGRIWAELRPEGGNRFVVELPIKSWTAQGTQPADHAILVVTADADLAQALGAAMKPLGHRPIQVESGEAALAEIVVHHYDLVLCDVSLPGMGIQRLYECAVANDPALSSHFVAIGAADAAPAGVPAIALGLESAQLQELINASLGQATAASAP